MKKNNEISLTKVYSYFEKLAKDAYKELGCPVNSYIIVEELSISDIDGLFATMKIRFGIQDANNEKKIEVSLPLNKSRDYYLGIIYASMFIKESED